MDHDPEHRLEGQDPTTGRDRPDPHAVEAEFDRLVSLPESERPAAIDRLRRNDPSLADEVASLLAYHREDAPEESAGHEPAPGFLTGRTLGGCRIGRLIGAGGMSAVYEASQEYPRRRVAVKVVRRERMSDSSALRLRIEAEALARLEHPNIARVYSAGSCPIPEVTGGKAGPETPYLVLELVEGAISVTGWADQRGLSPVERIEVVATVAEAIGHAHRAGVIHRDLKPANVIVGLDGVPKVIDFGIAAVVDAQETAATMGPIGTLSYMSPEQAAGGPVDTRSDVWGLGALLYDLLAGTPPFAMTGESLATHVARLLREPPEPVSRAAAARRDRGFLAAIPPSTDAVVAKALATDAEGRYRSSTELADELRRLVRGEPLLARPDSELDVAIRFFRRNRGPILAAGGVAAMVVGAFAWTLVLLGREREAHARAEWSAYDAAIAAAGGMIERGDASAARETLELAPERLRRWEWNHLAGRVDQAIWSLDFGYGQQVYGLEFSPDGRRLLGAVSSLSVAIDVPSRRVLWAKQTHSTGPSWRVRILSDGGGVFVRLHTQLERLDAKGNVLAIAIDPAIEEIALDRSGERLFTNTVRGFAIRDPWTLGLQREVAAVPPLAGNGTLIALTPAEDRVIVADDSGALTALDVGTGSAAWTTRIPGVTSMLRGLAISPDGRRIAAVSLTHIAMIDARDGTMAWHRIQSGRSFRSPSFTRDGRDLLVATWQESIDRFDAGDGQPLGSASGIFSQVWATAVSPDGRTFAAGGLSGRIGIFPLDASIDPPSLELDGSAVRSVALGHAESAGLAFASTASGGLWAIETGTGEVQRLESRLEARCVAVGPDGACAVGHAGGVAWIAPDGRVVAEVPLPVEIERVTALDGMHAFAVCRTSDRFGGAFIVRRGSGEAPARSWALQPRGIDCGAAASTASRGAYFIPSGHAGHSLLVRLADEDGTPLEEPFVRRDLPPQPEYPLVAALSPDGSTLAIGSVQSDSEVTLSDPATLEQRAHLPNHRGKVRSLAWSPGGDRLASAGMDDTVRIWDVGRNEEILVAWRGAANDLAWDEDGTLWIACEDGRIRRLRSEAASRLPGVDSGR